MMTLRRMVLFLLTLSRVLYLNCYKHGKQQHTYQYDSNKHRLFTSPNRITTNNNKDIVVVDRTSGVTGRVVVVGWEGDLRCFVYRCGGTTRFSDTYYNIIVTGHMDSQG
jgi:hypothetical protein